MRHFAIVASLAALTAMPAAALELADVPPTILETAKVMAPGATWSGVGTDYDTQRLAPEYEVKGKTAAGMDVEVDVSFDGALHEVETVIPAAEVPAPVMKLIGVYLQGFEPTKIEHSARPNNMNFYEFEGKVGGREIDIEVNAAGTMIIIADDAAI